MPNYHYKEDAELMFAAIEQYIKDSIAVIYGKYMNNYRYEEGLSTRNKKTVLHMRNFGKSAYLLTNYYLCRLSQRPEVLYINFYR